MKQIVAAWLLAMPAIAQTPRPPYPPSAIIESVTLDWTTHQRDAPGSDNRLFTGEADGHQYAP